MSETEPRSRESSGNSEGEHRLGLLAANPDGRTPAPLQGTALQQNSPSPLPASPPAAWRVDEVAAFFASLGLTQYANVVQREANTRVGLMMSTIPIIPATLLARQYRSVALVDTYSLGFLHNDVCSKSSDDQSRPSMARCCSTLASTMR